MQMSSRGSDSRTGAGMSGSVRAGPWVTLAHSSPRQVRGGWRGTANRGGRPSFSVCQQRNRYFLIYRGRTDYSFFLLALIVSKPLGTNDAVRSSFFPTFQRTVAIINLVIYDSNLQSLPWATHLLFKKRDAKHHSKGYAHTIVPGKKLKYEAFLFSYP